MNYTLHSTSSSEEFIEKSVDILSTKIIEAIAENGECLLGLSGGSTPKPIYEALGKVADIDWKSVYIFLVDERYIEPENPDSNQYLVRNTLLKHADIPEENLLFPDTALPLDVCLATYTRSLIELFSKQPPDIVTLGLGSDGHIASLFPPVAEDAFGEQLVLHTTTDAFAVHDRISVSPLVIMAAQNPVLMITGEEKKKVFQECIAADMNPTRWPLHVSLATDKLIVVEQS